MLDLLVLSNAVNFAGVAMALWLGFFNLTRSPRRTLTRVAALTLWAAAVYALYNLMYYNQLRESDSGYWLSLFRVSAFWGPVLWLHLSACFLPPKIYRRRLWLIAAMYVAAAVWTTFDSIPPAPILLRGWNHGSPLFISSKVPGDVFPLFIVYALVAVLLIAANLRTARAFARQNTTLRRHIDWASGASLLVSLGLAYLIGGVQLGVALPNLPGDMALIGGSVLMGYAVAHEAARRDGRAVQHDFFYTLLAISATCAAYLLATLISYLIYGLPFVTFIFVLMLAVVTHSMYDWARSALDRIFFHGPMRELRAGLRALAHESGTEHDMHQDLTALLSTLCHSVGATRGVLWLQQDDSNVLSRRADDVRPSAGRQDDSNVLSRHADDVKPSAGRQDDSDVLSRYADGQYIAEATYQVTAPAQPIPAKDLAAHDIGPFKGIAGLSGLSLIAPLQLVNEQVGALLLGPKENGSPYTDADEDLIAEVTDRMDVVIAQLTVQAERTRQLAEQVARYRESGRETQAEVKRQLEAVTERPMSAAGFSEKDLISQGEDALRHLSDIPYLSELALCRLPAVTQRLQPAAGTKLDKGKALKNALLEALDKLRPVDTAEPKLPGQEWFPFLILREAYVGGIPNREIMARLYISEGTFNRTRRRAVRAVAQALAEME